MRFCLLVGQAFEHPVAKQQVTGNSAATHHRTSKNWPAPHAVGGYNSGTVQFIPSLLISIRAVLSADVMKPASVESIESIIVEFQKGRDPEGKFQLLFEQFYERVCRFFQRKGIRPEDSQELAQEVFLSVYKGLADLRQPGQFQSWLFTVARNAYLNELERGHAKKREAVQVSLEEELPESDDLTLAERLAAGPESVPLEIVLDEERTEKLREAMLQLPEQMRCCVQFRVLQDASYQEIATIMGISINTVKAHLFKAREALKEKLTPYFAGVDF